MSISLLLERVVGDQPDRTVIVDGDRRLSAGQLSRLVDRAAAVLAASGCRHVAYVGTGGATLPVLLFAAARAGVPISPLNYRLGAASLRDLVDRLDCPFVVADAEYVHHFGAAAVGMSSDELLATDTTGQLTSGVPDSESVAVMLFTSGTTARPKAVELTHRNLTSFVTGTVEFASAATDETALICVPPYHIAGVAAALSNLYAGRRLVYLRQFDPAEWVRLVNAESVTTTGVVLTMLERIVSTLESRPTRLPTLRDLSYGGSMVPVPLVRRALTALPDVDLVNAYGLTETSSTVSILTPEDHRLCSGSTDEAVRRRLGSVGRPVPGIEIQIRDADGTPLPAGRTGELFVRGRRVSGRYAELGSVLDPAGWFATKDLAHVDDAGYLFLCGRSDDTIIRGGENIAPAEIEAVLVEHPRVRQVAVVGADDAEWGQIVVAVVVAADGPTPDPAELREFVRGTLRGSRTPDRIVFRAELPTTPTGKVLRRQLIDELSAT